VCTVALRKDEHDPIWKKVSDPSHRLIEGAKVSVYGKAFSEAAATSLGKNKLEATKGEAARLKSSVIFSDDNCLVINKPSGKIFSLAVPATT
jgi:23S rRNA-/tRNA-specific pseudouridylate synthase